MKNLTEVSLDTLFLQWGEVRKSIRECLKMTPDQLLNWAPKDGMRTFGQHYVHFATSLDWWLTRQFKDGGVWIPSVQESTDDRQRLDTHIVGAFERLKKYAMTADLRKMYEYKREPVSGYWAMLHLFEHDIHHRGQVKIYLRLNGIQPPED